MSTLGGSRGERNAKPKFSALDINSLYRVSRGENIEPLAQKNAVPRKHGMQSLGKVPSARRPPANLPSLKAETSTPAQDQSGTWAGTSDGTNQTQAPTTNVNNQGSSASSSNLDKQSVATKPLPNSSSNSSSNNTGASTQQHHQQIQQQNNSSNSSYSNNSNHLTSNQQQSSSSLSTTWSSVATGGQIDTAAQPPLYQSPQFQHEFPSLDGSIAPAQSKGNRGGVGTIAIGHPSSDLQQTNADGSQQNRTQNENYTQQQQQQQQHQQQPGGNASNCQQAQVLQQVPPQFRALMPQFMHRMGGMNAGFAVGFSTTATTMNTQQESSNQYGLPEHQQQQQQQQQQQPQQQNTNYSQNRQRSQQHYQQHGNYDDYSSYRGARGDRNNERPYRRGPPPNRSNRHEASVPYTESEMEFSGIIKEEELERMDKIVKEDGWDQNDEIDYNQKLVFSDDDSDSPPPTSTKGNNQNKGVESKRGQALEREKERNSQQRKDEDNQAVWNREREQRKKEREQLDRDQNERNDREKDRNSDSNNRMQQNGHRIGGGGGGGTLVDAEVLERVKQRKKEEEKRVNERKLAAAKKLQELEQKINKKKELLADENDASAPASYNKSESSDSRATLSDGGRYISRSDESKLRGDREGKDARDYGSRSSGYESKYERDINSRERDAVYKDNNISRDRDGRNAANIGGAANAGNVPFFKQFHADLPPRFQKQRDQERTPYDRNERGERTERVERDRVDRSDRVDRGEKIDRSDRGGYTSNRSNAYQNESKNVPFAQQYDPRYIHSQNFKQQQQQQQQHHSIKRNTTSDEIVLAQRGMDIGSGNLRKRFDSEEDDRFSSGRESISRNSAADRPSQLARSVSDSSQRKTSVSSEDKPLDSSMRSDRSSESREKIGSWADEMEPDFKQIEIKSDPIVPILKSQLSNTSSGSANDENQPKHILQRVRKVSIESRSDKEKSEERELLQQQQPSSNAGQPNAQVKASNQSAEDTSKLLGTSPSIIEAPKSWGDCVPTTPEIARSTAVSQQSTTENLTESNNTLIKSSDAEKKPLKRVLENESSSDDKKTDDKSNLAAAKQAVRNYTSGHSKDTHSSDDGKHGNIQKRPSPRGGRHDIRGPTSRSYGSYRGGSNNWNRRGGSVRSGRYNDYSESDGSDDEYHGRDGRKDDGYKQNVGNRRSGQQSQQKETFVPRGEPSRRGRGGGPAFRRTGAPIVKRFDNYGPPSAKSPFGASEEKPEKDNKNSSSADDKVKQNQLALTAGIKKVSDATKTPTKRTDECYESASEHSDSQDKSKITVTASKTTSSTIANSKTSLSTTAPTTTISAGASKPSSHDDKKQVPSKSTFGGLQQQQRKDSTGQKIESQTHPKADENQKSTVQIQAPLPQRTEKPPNAPSSEKLDKNSVAKKDESNYVQNQRNNPVPSNRSKPQLNAQTNIKTPQQPLIGKAPAATPKSGSVPAVAQQGIQQQAAGTQNTATTQQTSVKQIQDRANNANNNRQLPNKLAPRFVKQQRDRNVPNQQSNSWDKMAGDVGQIGEMKESDFNQRQGSGLQQADKNAQDSNVKSEPTKMSTIIFENTNFKTMPPPPIKRQQGPPPQQHQNHHHHHAQSSMSQPHHSQQHNLDKKPEDVFKNASSGGNFQDMLDSQQQQQQQQLHHQVQRSHQSQSDSISSALQTMSFPKSDAEYEKDLKLAFTFESEMLADDKNNKSGLCIPPPRSSAIHSVATGQNTISPSIADLSKKITSVKKVWESVPSMPTVIEHGGNAGGGNNDDSHLSSTFVSSQHQQHMHQFVHPHSNMSHVQHALSPAPGSYSNSFGPDHGSLEHFAKAGDGDIDNVGYSPSPQHMVGGHNAHQNAVLKHAAEALATSTNVCKVKPTQQQLHQSSLGLSPPPMQQGTLQAAPQPYYQPSQFGGMSAIPSPPAVLYNSSPMPSQGNLYGHFQLEPNRSQFSQYPAHYGAAGNAPYNAYMQTGPNLQTAPAPDLYQGITSQFRMGGTVQPPYNQTQQINNQSTVLISSTSNSLMSASVKPSTQQIGAIGTKAGAVGQSPYGQQYMGMYATPPQQAPPPQSNSYYSNSASGQGTFFGAPATGGNYNLQAATAGMFSAHGGPQAPPPSNAPPPQQPVANYSSQFLSSPLLAINRQYQSGPSPQNAAATYMKGNPQQQQQTPQNQQQSQQNQGQGQQQQQLSNQSQQQNQQSNQQPQQQQQQQQSHAQDSVSSNSFFK